MERVCNASRRTSQNYETEPVSRLKMAETSAGGTPQPFMGSGVRKDLHTLRSKFLAANSMRIRDFAAVFREMHFETILHYRINPAEYVEFTEYLLQNAAKYFGKVNEVKAERKFEERVFGIYTCYAIYNLQPVNHVVQIPVTTMQYEELLEFQKVLCQAKWLEPVAALKSLLLKKAFRISLFQSMYDPATHKRYLAEEELPEFLTEAEIPFAGVKSIETNKLMHEMMYVHEAYLKGKQRLGLHDVKLVDAMNPLETVQQHIRNQEIAFSSKPVAVQVAQTAGASRSELRSRAYAADMKHTRSRRYLDPEMEKNFAHLQTFADIAQECLQEPAPIKKTKGHRKRRQPVVKPEEQPLSSEQIAEQVIQNEYASRVKPEIPEVTEEQAMFGLKRQGTGGVAKITAPAKKKIKLVEVKTERRHDEESFSSAAFDDKKKKKGKSAPPQMNHEWASRMSTFNGSLDATDKQLKKLQSQIKIEPHPDS